MLTFSEALTLLKAGQDMRQSTWPRGTFIRAVPTSAMSAPEIRRYTAGSRSGVAYTPNNVELFNQNWTTA